MRVFISSTQRDLIEHRNAVAEALERLGLQLARMETFGARPEDATRACLEEVTESDLFVGVYAHRYGHIPAASAVSVTEAEFDHAVVMRRPTFCFLVDDDYPWPDELREPEPGKSKLVTFKSRIAALVVRDTFTTADVLATRVASSVGRYLIADPRRHGARTAAHFARLALTDIAAALFVDVVRLACVAASVGARQANAARYPEFVDMADQHFSEFRTHVPRLAADTDFAVIEKCGAVERSVGWALTRLRRAPRLDRSWPELALNLHEAAERVDDLAAAAAGDYYAERREEVAPIIEKMVNAAVREQSPPSPESFVHARFSAQDAMLAHLRARGGFAIAAVRDDIDRRLAIPYFLVDLALLRQARAQDSRPATP